MCYQAATPLLASGIIFSNKVMKFFLKDFPTLRLKNNGVMAGAYPLPSREGKNALRRVVMEKEEGIDPSPPRVSDSPKAYGPGSR